VLLGLPPAPPPTPPPLPLIAAGSGNRAQDQAQGIGRLSSFAHALHARPQSIAETRGVAARARLPPGCPAVRSILLLRLSPTNGARAKGKGHGPKQSLLQQPTQTPPAPPRVARGPHAAPLARRRAGGSLTRIRLAGRGPS